MHLHSLGNGFILIGSWKRKSVGRVQAEIPILVCIVEEDEPTLQRISSPLISLSIQVKGFKTGAAFLLSGLASRCDCLIVDERASRPAVRELVDAIRSAGLQTAILVVVSSTERSTPASDEFNVICNPLTESALLEGLRKALADRRGKTIH